MFRTDGLSQGWSEDADHFFWYEHFKVDKDSTPSLPPPQPQKPDLPFLSELEPVSFQLIAFGCEVLGPFFSRLKIIKRSNIYNLNFFEGQHELYLPWNNMWPVFLFGGVFVDGKLATPLFFGWL